MEEILENVFENLSDIYGIAQEISEQKNDLPENVRSKVEELMKFIEETIETISDNLSEIDFE